MNSITCRRGAPVRTTLQVERADHGTLALVVLLEGIWTSLADLALRARKTLGTEPATGWKLGRADQSQHALPQAAPTTFPTTRLIHSLIRARARRSRSTAANSTRHP